MAKSKARKATTHNTRNEVPLVEGRGDGRNQRMSPSSFHTPLLLQAITQKR